MPCPPRKALGSDRKNPLLTAASERPPEARIEPPPTGVQSVHQLAAIIGAEDTLAAEDMAEALRVKAGEHTAELGSHDASREAQARPKVRRARGDQAAGRDSPGHTTASRDTTCRFCP